MTKIPASRIIEAKTGITRAILSEPFLVSLHRVQAPYRGCGHGCRYCDGRAEKYYVEGDFERDIMVRTNLPDLVKTEVASGILSREYGAICIGSGVTDVYQPLERDLELTRRTLEALVPARQPIVILTKNDLILRDFDILSRFPKVLVIVTVTTANAAHASILEPCASSPAERLEIVRRAKEAGFLSGVMAMPMCPGISESLNSFTAVVDAAERAGTDFVYPGGLTLRPGRQKEFFLSLIDDEFPDLIPLYENMYRENRQSGAPLLAEYTQTENDWHALLRSRGIARMIPHKVYRELLSPPDSLFVLLCHMESLYSSRNINTKPLSASLKGYAYWLKEERSSLRRKRIKPLESDPFPITRILGEKLNELCANNGIARVLGNEKLASLVTSVVRDNTVFDYATLSITI